MKKKAVMVTLEQVEKVVQKAVGKIVGEVRANRKAIEGNRKAIEKNRKAIVGNRQAIEGNRKAIEKRLVRGRSIEAMVAATVYASARMRRLPRTLDEIALESRVSKKELGRCYRYIVRKLALNIPLASPIDYLVRFGTELRLSGTCQRRAAVILRDAKMEGLTAGKDPTGLAAAAIYIAGISNGERRTQRRIAEVAHVTEVTVRNRYKELVRELEIKIAI